MPEIPLNLAYEPITPLLDDRSVPVNVSLEDYNRYMQHTGLAAMVENLVISPFEEELKKRDLGQHTFGTITITVKRSPKPSTSWEKINAQLESFLELRADDARAATMEDVRLIEGVGYCMPVQDVVKQIEDNISKYTSISHPTVLYWPQAKKDEQPVREILIPTPAQYKSLTEANARMVLHAKRFGSGLEKEVKTRFKDTLKRWMWQQTGYDEDNIPAKEDSPVTRWQQIGPYTYMVVNAVREDRPEYQKVIGIVLTDLKSLEEGERTEGYRYSRKEGRPLINIKSVRDRLVELYKENTPARLRQEITP